MIVRALNGPPPRSELQRLMALPFTSAERDSFVEYLRGVEKQNGVARDVLLMWNIQTSRFAEAKEMIRMDGSHVSDKRRIIREGLEKASIL
jgi:hypothetical protein